MTDPTQATPIVGGTPPAGPPPGQPPTGGPGGPAGPGGPGGPEEPGGGMDRRLVAILGLLGAIVVLLVILLLVVLNDGDDTPATTTTTTTVPTTTSESTTTTSESTTTTSEATTTTTTSTTSTTTTTTTTTAPPPTIAPARCVGADGTDDPDDTAIVFYDAWTLDDVDCAERVATDEAIDTLFAANGSGADWSFEGCFGDLLGDAPVECAFRYEGGAAFFEMQIDGDDRWEVADVRFQAD